MADGTTLTDVAMPFVSRARPDVAPRPFQLFDSTDHASHRGIDEPGQVYADLAKHAFGATVTISTCEGSVDIEAADFDDLVKAYVSFRPALRDELRQAGVAR